MFSIFLKFLVFSDMNPGLFYHTSNMATEKKNPIYFDDFPSSLPTYIHLVRGFLSQITGG
jgi:hypothetical protein